MMLHPWLRAHGPVLLASAILLIGAIFFVRESVSAFGHVEQAVHSGDEHAFYQTAKAPLGSRGFWMGSRPPVVPLVHKLAGYSDLAIFRWQLGIQIAAALTLSLVTFLLAGRRAVGLLGALGVLALALAPQVNSWALVIRSESVSFSLLLMLVAACGVVLYFLDGRAKWWSLALGLLAMITTWALLTLTRENWLYSGPLLAAGILAAWLGRRSCGPAATTRAQAICVLAACATLLVLFQAGAVYGKRSMRYKTNISNAVFINILPNQEFREEWSRDYGLPVDSELMRWNGKAVWTHGRTIVHHPPYRDWLEQQGLSSYKRHLLRHPRWTLDLVTREFRNSMDQFAAGYTKGGGRKTPLSRVLERHNFVRFHLYGEAILISCFSLGLFIGLSSSRRTIGSLGWLLAIFSMIAASQSALIILADPMEIPRHHLPITQLSRFLLLLGLTVLLAALAGGVRAFVRAWNNTDEATAV